MLRESWATHTLVPKSFLSRDQPLWSKEETVLHATVALADRSGVPVVATNDVRFPDLEMFEAHVPYYRSHPDDTRRVRQFTDQQYLKSAQEMCELFADIPISTTRS